MKKILWLLFSCCVFSFASAESLNYNIVHLSAQSVLSVPRDTMEAILVIEKAGKDRQSVSNEVTERSNRVLQKIKSVSAVQGELSSRDAYPMYKNADDKKPVWHDTARITVKSRDFDKLSQLIADVQTDAALGDLNFSVSREIRAQNDRTLIEDAIKKFREQANHITRALGGKSYKIVQLDINRSARVFNGALRMATATRSVDAAAVPEVEAGKEELTANVSGSIQVQ